MGAERLDFSGEVVAIQPHVRMTRSFDQREETYLGYIVMLLGEVDAEEREFSVAIDESIQKKHQLRVGDVVAGKCVAVKGGDMGAGGFEDLSDLEVDHTDRPEYAAPPWSGVPPDLATYRKRGFRRLNQRTYETQCIECIWGCHMAVEMIIDQWNPRLRRYRPETFCYGPKSCRIYKPGRARVVPGRKGMSWVEEDWVDEEMTRHRSDDE
jgi:hypothetical protein